MGKYIKKFDTHTEYETYINGSNKVLPNVSYVVDNNGVYYNPWVETRLLVTYNVTDASSPTTLMGYGVQSLFSDVEIDGVIQPSVVTEYQFNTTGEHIVKYTLANPTSIGERTFEICDSLMNVTIPNSVTSIGDSAFAGCSGLTSVTIGSGVTSIGGAFYGCGSLSSITVDSSNVVYDSRNNCNAIIQTATNTLIQGSNSTVIPSSVTSIGGSAFSECSGLTSITIPNSVTSIGINAFFGCSGLTSITIPSSVTSISECTFESCTGLTRVIIPNSVTSIGDAAFASCKSLTSVTIPSEVTSIGGWAFASCSGLTSVTVEATTPPTLDNAVFDGTNNYPIYVPSASVEAYKAATNWSAYASRIQAIPTT